MATKKIQISDQLAKYFDPNKVNILKNVLNQRGVFGVREIARNTKINPATTHRILQKLISVGLIHKVLLGNSFQYVLDTNSDWYKSISSLFYQETSHKSL